jgi:hypothetical protein
VYPKPRTEKKDNRKFEEPKEKKFPNIFDASPYLKFLEKTEKENDDNSSDLLDDHSRLPAI